MIEEKYVISNLKTPLLGVTAIEGLGLAAQLQVIADEFNIQHKNFSVFSMEEGAEPYAINVPHKIAIPLKPIVKAEIERMEQLGVISRIEDPTTWCRHGVRA